MSFQQPSVFVFGVRIDEPVTSLTGLIISGVCLYAFVRLSRIPVQRKTNFYLRYYFLIMSIATANGGIIGHAFLYQFSFSWKLVGWILSMLSIMLIERASIEYVSSFVNPRFARALKWINIFELLFFMTVTCVTLNFFFVEAHTTYGLLIVVASLHFYAYRKTQSPGSRLFLVAVVIAAISAIIYMNKWGISPWFNHNDISHVLLTVTAWFFYLGGRKIAME